MPPDPTLPPSLAAELADLKRRLANLERSPSIPFSSTRGGTFLFLDDDGNVRYALGNVNLDGSISGITGAYGQFIYGDAGAILLAAREGDQGLTYPEVSLPARRADTGADITITSGTFATIFEYRHVFPAYEVFNCLGFIATDVGTTAEVRLICGSTTTSVATVPSGGNGSFSFQWLHPAPVGLYDPASTEGTFIVGVQVRRASGAGNVTFRQPYEAKLTSKFFLPSAATNGNPSFA